MWFQLSEPARRYWVRCVGQENDDSSLRGILSAHSWSSLEQTDLALARFHSGWRTALVERASPAIFLRLANRPKEIKGLGIESPIGPNFFDQQAHRYPKDIYAYPHKRSAR
jgi:hypothetical protein